MMYLRLAVVVVVVVFKRRNNDRVPVFRKPNHPLATVLPTRRQFRARYKTIRLRCGCSCSTCACASHYTDETYNNNKVVFVFYRALEKRIAQDFPGKIIFSFIYLNQIINYNTPYILFYNTVPIPFPTRAFYISSQID